VTFPAVSEDSARPDATQSHPKIALRLVSGVAAIVVLVLSATFTLGTSLAAPFGVFAGRHLAERRGRRFTTFATWLSAAVASSIAILLGFALLLSLVPESAWQEIQEAVTKAQTQDTHSGPAWMRPDPVTEQIVTSRAFTTVFGVLGLALGCALFGAIAGTPGWLATLLLAYAIRGRRAA
jgi:hypothetical protein